MSICEGKITRKKHMINSMTESILDFFIVCEQILPLVTKMTIDEKGEIGLTKYRKGCIVKSDHNMLKLEIDLKFHNDIKHERIEMFNLRNKTCQADFRVKTTNTDKFSNCFLSEESINTQFDRWHRKLFKALHTSFKKIRIKDKYEKKTTNIDILMTQKRNILKKKVLDQNDKEDIENFDHFLPFRTI